MRYSPEAVDSAFDRDIRALNDKLRICRAVDEMTKTDGWFKTVGPLLERMLVDVVGGKVGGKWVSGKVDRARTDERREFYVGYKQALIDVLNRVMFHVEQVKVIEDRIAETIKAKEQKFYTPLEETKYAAVEG